MAVKQSPTRTRQPARRSVTGRSVARQPARQPARQAAGRAVARRPPARTAAVRGEDGQFRPTVAADGSELVFGVVFNFRGTDIPISTTDIKDAKEKGVEFRLPERVELGTLTDFTTWIGSAFKVTIPDWKELPSPLSDIVNYIATLNVAVNELHVKVPGTSQPGAKKEFTVGMQGMWPGNGINLIPGLEILSLRGLFLGATNEAKQPSQ